MRLDNNQQAFFALVRAGLWGDLQFKVDCLKFKDFQSVDWGEVYRLAEEQSVIGLVAAGLETMPPAGRPPQEVLLQFVGMALQIEQQNKAMNDYVAWLIDYLRSNDIYAILVKGQGIAQCYARPLWRASGDVDLLLNDENYEKAKKLLVPLALEVQKEYKTRKHLEMTMEGGFSVELHGTMHNHLPGKANRMIDEVQQSVFRGNVRSWQNNNISIFLPSPDNDVTLVFSHILQHFYLGGVGLRQICDWCRLLWTFREEIDVTLLEKRLLDADLMTEWKAFAVLTADWLGMPVEVIPLYSDDKKWRRKADRILAYVMKSGNFGHNRDMSYRLEKSAVTRKWKTFCHLTADTIRQIPIFPMDSVKVWGNMIGIGLRSLFDNGGKR